MLPQTGLHTPTSSKTLRGAQQNILHVIAALPNPTLRPQITRKFGFAICHCSPHARPGERSVQMLQLFQAARMTSYHRET